MQQKRSETSAKLELSSNSTSMENWDLEAITKPQEVPMVDGPSARMKYRVSQEMGNKESSAEESPQNSCKKDSSISEEEK